MEDIGEAKLDWFKTFLELPNGIPSRASLYRVFHPLDTEPAPRQLEEIVAMGRTHTLGCVAFLSLLRHPQRFIISLEAGARKRRLEFMTPTPVTGRAAETRHS